MENSELHWEAIKLIAKKYWEEDLSYLNAQQIELVEQAITTDQEIVNLLQDHPGGYKFDLQYVLENAKVIFELVIVIVNLVLLLKKEKNDDEILLEVKRAKKGKNIEIKMKEMKDDDIKKVIQMIKAYYSK